MALPIGITAPPAPVIAPDPLVVIPYVHGWLREETTEAVHAWGGSWCTRPIEDGDPYGYAKAFEQWWGYPGDLVIVEHDIVPADGQIAEMLQCPEEWCSAAYSVGEGRTTTGLGLTKISARAKAYAPYGGENCARDPRDHARYVDWTSLNESVERHLSRLGFVQHIHTPNPVHLHYPEADNA